MNNRQPAFIFARGGSKGVPGKNIRDLGGKPLIAHAIECALQSRSIDRVWVSTDDQDIAAVAKQYGAEVPFMRPAELAADDSAEWLSWRHAITQFEQITGQALALFISVPTTSPLRSVQDVDACIDKIKGDDFDIVVTGKIASRSPYFNMVSIDYAGLAHLVCSPETAIANRQSAPQVFDMTTVCYVAKPSFIMEAMHTFEGRVGMVEVPEDRAIDIDTELDFKIAELILKEKRHDG